MNQGYQKYYKRIKSIYDQPVISASIEVILSVFTIALLIIMAIRPTIGTILTLRKSIEDLTELSTKLNSKITSLTQAKQTLEKNSSVLSLYRQAVPNDPDLMGLAKRIEILAQENELKLESVNYEAIPVIGDSINIEKGKGTAISTDKSQPVVINLNIVGKFTNVAKLIKDLGNIDRLVLIDAASFQKLKMDPANEMYGSVKMNLMTSIYYKIAPKR